MISNSFYKFLSISYVIFLIHCRHKENYCILYYICQKEDCDNLKKISFFTIDILKC